MRAALRATLLPALIWTLAPGCGVGQPGEPDVISTGRPIYYGSPDSTMAVVAITYGPGQGYFCSGTLITPTVVMTAAHCLEDANTSYIQIYFGDNVWQGGQYRDITEAEIHPQYDPNNVVNDIALIRLASSPPAGTVPIPPLPASQALTSADHGIPLDFSGFGVTENNNSGVKLHVEQALGLVCPGPNGCSYNGGWASPRTIAYSQSGGGPCSGDSGGPAFVDRGGQRYVAGITSYGDPYCTQYGVSTKVDAFGDFISDFTGGITPEDCATPGDEDGDGLADCADPDCATHPDCQGPDACESAALLACGATINDTTVGGENRFNDYSCLSQSSEQGPEKAYEITAPAGTDVTANLTISGTGDLDLFLLPPSGASCNPLACIEASLNQGQTAESLSFTVPAGGAFLVVDTFANPSGFTLTLTCNGSQPEICTNTVDDDNDGLADCNDPDCATDPACSGTPENCINNVDDDGDSLVDCDDPDCSGTPACDTGDENCVNGIDDDGDSFIDCDDLNCAQHPLCTGTPEECTNTVDDDGDGLADCADPDCDNHIACQSQSGELRTVTGGCNCGQSPTGGVPLLPFWLAILGVLLWRRSARS